MSIMSAKVHCHVDSEHYLGKNTLLTTQGPILKVQIKCFLLPNLKEQQKSGRLPWDCRLPFLNICSSSRDLTV